MIPTEPKAKLYYGIKLMLECENSKRMIHRTFRNSLYLLDADERAWLDALAHTPTQSWRQHYEEASQ